VRIRVLAALVSCTLATVLVAGVLGCQRERPPPQTSAEAFYRASDAGPVSDNDCRSAGGVAAESVPHDRGEAVARRVLRMRGGRYCFPYMLSATQPGTLSAGKQRLCCYPLLDFQPDPL
jgi:hypothetical protein